MKIPRRKRTASRKADGIPLYRHMYADLRLRIQQGKFPRGSAIPSERELRHHYGVSAITVKRAVAELALEGLVRTSRGLRTRVVSRVGATQYGTNIRGLIKGLEQQFSNANSEVLDFRTVTASQDIALALHLGKSPKLQRVAIVASRDGERYSYWQSYVPERIGAKFTRELLAQKPRLLLYANLGIRPFRGSQVLSACPASADVARVLNVKRGAPLLRLTRTLFDRKEQAIEYVVAYFPWDRYEYAIALSGD